MKTCTKCGDAKPVVEFWRDQNRKDGLNPWCKSCNRAAMQGVSRRAAMKRRALLAQLKSEPCADCGGRFPPCVMDFDHRPEETKLFAIARRRLGSVTSIMAEIAKCDLVCANCHRIRTQARTRRTA